MPAATARTMTSLPGWSDQQAELAENQMSFFEVGSGWRFGHEDFRLPGNPDTMRRRKRGNTSKLQNITIEYALLSLIHVKEGCEPSAILGHLAS
jgi:hypothetical protein